MELIVAVEIGVVPGNESRDYETLFPASKEP